MVRREAISTAKDLKTSQIIEYQTDTEDNMATAENEGLLTQRKELEGKIALVTGANSGIGKEAALQLGERGCTVVMCSRSLTKTDEARSEIMKRIGTKDPKQFRIVQLDLADLDNVRSFPTRYEAEMQDLKDRPLDITILNAGVMTLPERQLTKQGIEMQMGVNVIGHFLLFSVLYDKWIKPAPHARVVFTGSQFYKLANGKIDFDDFNRDKSYWKWIVYGETKLGTYLLMARMNRLLEQRHRDNVVVVSGQPGYANTGIHRHNLLARIFSPFFGQSASLSAQSIVLAATDPNAQRNGYAGPKYLMHMYGGPTWTEGPPCDEMFDEGLQDQFWAKCEQLSQAHLEEKL